MSSTRINSIYNSRFYILELLEMEKYQVQEYQGFNTKEVDAMCKNDQLDMVVSRATDGHRIYVKYVLGKTLNKFKIQDFIEDLYDSDPPFLNTHDTLVVIVDHEPNASLIEMCKKVFEQRGIYIMVYNILRLQFNVRKHTLNPAVRVLTDEEVAALKEKYKIKNIELEIPEIDCHDPLAMAVFIKPGQVMHIVRDSPTAVQSTLYRYCV
jgi:DNA-directed RNA polymerase subunit H (RpoH/RPB5)